MAFTTTGEVVSGFHVLGYPQIPLYYLEAPRPVIFDAGVTALTPAYLAHLEQVTNGVRPSFLFLTHTHFDHVGATAGILDAYPGVRVGGAAKAASVLGRPNAIKLIGRLNREVSDKLAERGLEGALLSQEPFRPFAVERVVEEGDRLDLGKGWEMEVLATPGHTWDCLTYWLPKAKILVAGEAAGCQQLPGNIVTEFLVDYQAYEDTIARLSSLGAQALCQGHHMVHMGPEVDDFFARSLTGARAFRRLVLELLQEKHGDQEAVVTEVKAREWDPCPEPKQAKTAYLLNLRARVRVLAENPGGGA